MQLAVERALEGRRGGVVLLDADSGDVLAMASFPTFDPNYFTRYLPGTEWKRLRDPRLTPLINRAIEGEYQPGSTFKIVTGYAGLLERLVAPEELVPCSGSFQLGKRTAHCWKPGGHGGMDFARALGQSCNVYFYSLGARLDVDSLASAAAGFGLGHATGLGLPGERTGKIPDLAWRTSRRASIHRPWNTGDTVNASIGQGDVMVTPLQMARLIAAVSNGGRVYRPRLVSRIIGPDGEEVRRFDPVLDHEMRMPPDVLEPLRAGLRLAVAAGTATRARMTGVSVFGKTGSAQNPGRKTHAWFVGVMESRSPSVAVAVLLEGAGAGGTEAVPVARAALGAVQTIIERRRKASEASEPAQAVTTASLPSVPVSTTTTEELASQERLADTTDPTGLADDSEPGAAFLLGIDPDETVEYGAGDDALYIEN